MHKSYRFLFPILLLILAACTPKTKIPVIKFEPINTGTEVEIRALHVISEDAVWAAASEGTVLLSVDGGDSWEISQIPSEEKNQFRSLHAWNDKKALVVGINNPARFYLTEDGGDSWKVVHEIGAEGVFFNSMKFADDQNGLALSDPIDNRFLLLKTTDGGYTWERVENLPDIVKGEANFAASNTCIEYLPSGEAWFVTGGQSARVFRSKDHGQTWEVSDAPIIDGNSNSGIYSVFFSNPEEGVITGGTWNNPGANRNVAARTNDGGITWQPSKIMPGAFRSCVKQFADDEKRFFMAIGKTGCDYSLDKGLTWYPVKCEGYYTIRPVPGKMKGFAAGAKGRMARIVIE